MSEKMKFFIYLLEHYAQAHNTSADTVLQKWDALGISDLIYEMYDLYHTESLDNAYEDIDRMIQEKSSQS